MAILEVLVFLISAAPATQVGDWKVECTDSLQLNDGSFEKCQMTKKADGLEVEIVRTAEGIATSVKQKGCKPPTPVAPTRKTQQEISSNADVLLGSVIANLMANQIACRARAGAVQLPLKDGEAVDLLAATTKIRGL